jgi:hypothetical protein
MKYLKRFNESKNYYDDDMNVDITSTVIDILQDLIDEGLNIQCFTVGYKTLKETGVKYTENDISLYIMANSDDYFEYHKLDYKKLMPYLERVMDYVESEGRVVDIELQWRPLNKKGVLGRLQSVDYKYPMVDLSQIPDRNYESISFKFKLKK